MRRMNTVHTRHSSHSNHAASLLWFALALLLHCTLLFAARFQSLDRTNTQDGEFIEVSLIEMAAAKSDGPPAPLSSAPPAPPPPIPSPPAPPQKPVVKPRPKPRSAPRPAPVPEAPSLPVTEPVEAPPASAASVATPQSGASPTSHAFTPGRSTATGAGNGASGTSGTSGASGTSGTFAVGARFNAAYLHNPRPPYPMQSRRLREEGTVHLRVHVLPDGRADQVEIRRGSGYARLDESARATVLRWRFVPGRRGTVPVASWVIVPIRFNLESTSS
jgi:protein TonB